MLCKTVRSLKSPTGAFIAPLRCANANLSGRGPSILLRKTVRSLKVPTGDFIASQTRTFENTLLSAGCKKDERNFGKKREGWTVPALLTRFVFIKIHRHSPFVRMTF